MAQAVVNAAETAEDTQQGKYLTFHVENELYGLEIRYVTEIIGIQAITFVPNVPAYVKGIINLRGKVIPVIDIRLRFQKQESAYTERTCVIVVDVGGVSLGIIVEGVNEVVDIPDDTIVPPPDLKTEARSGYVKQIGNLEEKVVLILDCEKIMHD